MAKDFQAVRRTSEQLCETLATEDFVLQAMEDVSPPKWHLAHVTWFFETFILRPHLPGYRPLNERYRFLFNSYYNSAGPQYYRPARGLLSRPTVAEVYVYRAHVDAAIQTLVAEIDEARLPDISGLIVVGLNHEQQHQELLLTDIKYSLSVNPLRPAYYKVQPPRGSATPPLRWLGFEGGLCDVGHDGSGFAFDNEWPRHRTYLRPFKLASRLVTNGEYLEFMKAGGYRDWRFWMSEGWKLIQAKGWTAPLYWEQVDGTWSTQTLAGLLPLDEHAPVSHVSYYEADAFAQWAGRRLPTEHEWEHAASRQRHTGHLMDSGVYHPLPALGLETDLEQMIGDVWEWTRSPYAPYPGYQPLSGPLAEYNGKFMVNQMVLRGGSCVTPASHIRITYRNFFPPDARWQFSGIRLAEDA
ncbi:MAG TPA: ergothioneine biosynthesis protein EgtB [Candidatus Sulfotelmatobacter sp.]|nr:ergothioneine biosynthesis protein EgtB [Candidatus Sulfotelmatobacter sp.]